MSTSSVSSTSSVMQQMMLQMQQNQAPKPPSAADLVSQAMEASDIDGDSLLSIDETGLSEEDFNSYDTDGDGSLSSSELEETISARLDAMKNQELTPEGFASFLSDLGVEVPPPPSHHGAPDASKIASDIFEQSDVDGDGLMTIDELGISEDLFSSLDADEDGNITQDELEEGLNNLFSSVDSGEITKEEAGEVLSALGVEPPQAPQGGQAPMMAAGGSSEDEEYDAADTNQDGIVTAAEQAAYDGETLSQSEMQDYTMDLVSKLFEALKASENEDTTDLSSFKSIMTMMNNETQDSKTANQMNQYVSNLDLGLRSA